MFSTPLLDQSLNSLEIEQPRMSTNTVSKYIPESMVIKEELSDDEGCPSFAVDSKMAKKLTRRDSDAIVSVISH